MAKKDRLLSYFWKRMKKKNGLFLLEVDFTSYSRYEDSELLAIIFSPIKYVHRDFKDKILKQKMCFKEESLKTKMPFFKNK